MRLRTNGVTWQEIDGEIVLLDLDRSVYLTTNGSGAVLVKLLDENRSRDELIGALIAQYGIDSQQAQADIDAFVASLTEKGLLEQ